MSRLTRSRSTFHKAQYVRIQALHLVQDARPPLYGAALELLDLLLLEFPDRSQLAGVHKQRGQCLVALGRGSEALDEFQRAMETERYGIRSYAYLEFIELVLALDRKDLFHEALSIISKQETPEPFPVTQYRRAAATAFLCEELGMESEAQAHATLALAAAAQAESPFRYHRKLGLVAVSDLQVQNRLRKLAGQSALSG